MAAKGCRDDLKWFEDYDIHSAVHNVPNPSLREAAKQVKPEKLSWGDFLI